MASQIQHSALKVLMLGTDWTLASENSEGIGGGQYRLRRYATHLDRLDVIIRTYDDQPNLHQESFALSDNLFVHPTHSRKSDFFVDMYLIASRLIAEHQYDIIAAHDASIVALVAFALRSRYRIPVSVSVYGDHIANPLYTQEGFRQQATDFLARWILRRADTIRVDSNIVKARLVSLGLPSDRIWSYPVFIRDLEQWNTGNGNVIRERFRIGDQPLIVCIARLEAQKNIPNLIKAFHLVIREIPEARCIIVGSGSKESELHAMVEANGLQDVCFFAGAAQYTELIMYYAACDVLTLSSNYEGIPRVLIEGAAAERPIVATRVGGIAEVVEDKVTGLLVPPNSPEALANAFIALLSNRAIAKNMGCNGRQAVLGAYNEHKLVPKYIQVWRETAIRAKKQNKLR